MKKMFLCILYVLSIPAVNLLFAEADIRLEPPEWQMGDLTTGGQYTIEVKLQTTGAGTTDIIEARPSCPCMTPTVLSPTISPAADGIVRILYKEDSPPGAPAHYFRKFVYIRISDPANPVRSNPVGAVPPKAERTSNGANPILTFNISGKSPGAGIPAEEIIVFRTADAPGYEEVKRRLETIKSQSQTAVIKEYLIGESTESIRQRLKNQFSVTQSGDVELLINRGAFIGADNALKQLEQMSAMPQMYFPPLPAVAPPPSFVTPTGTTTEGKTIIEILFFYSAGCPDCRQIKDTLLPHLRNRFGDKIIILDLDIADMNNYRRLVALQEKHQVKSNSPVSLVIGDRFLSGVTEITGQAEMVIEQEITSPVEPTPSAIRPDIRHAMSAWHGRDSASLRNRFLSFKTATIIGAGLLDGINPCAFATIIFFISFLTFAGRTRKEILAVGVFYTIAVFLTYLFLGIGAFKTLQTLAVYGAIRTIILYLTAALVFSLAGLSINDLVSYLRTGQTKGITLQLPLSLKQRIHSVIRDKVATNPAERDNVDGPPVKLRPTIPGSNSLCSNCRSIKPTGLVFGALVIGFLVTLFEAACTGQVYLPTIVFMLNDPQLKANAVWYLLLYNLMFVIPLVVVFVLAYFGVGLKMFTRFAERNIVLSKVLMTLFFIGLGVILLMTNV